MKLNKIMRISLSGGILGALFTNPRAALDRAIAAANSDGWNCVQVLPHRTTNLAIAFLQSLVLVCTLFLWTWGQGYIVVLEREVRG